MKEYYIVEDGKPRGAFSVDDLQRRNIQPTTLIWHEGWIDWQTMEAASSELPELQTTIGEPIEEEDEILSSFPLLRFFNLSYMNRTIGQRIDQLLERKQDKTRSHFFYRWLNRRRTFFLELPLYKQEGKCFFYFALLILMVLGLVIGNGWGWLMFKIWIVSLAFMQFSYLASKVVTFLSTIAHSVLAFLPKWLRRFLIQPYSMIPMAIIIITYFWGWLIALVYCLYQLFIYFTGINQIPSFAQKQFVTLKNFIQYGNH